MDRTPTEDLLPLWYWGASTRELVNETLVDKCDGSFLVRDSSKLGELTLTVKYGGTNHMIRIINEKQTGMFGFGQTFQFISVADLIEWYSTHSLSDYFTTLDVMLSTPVLRIRPIAVGSQTCLMHQNKKKRSASIDEDSAHTSPDADSSSTANQYLPPMHDVQISANKPTSSSSATAMSNSFPPRPFTPRGPRTALSSSGGRSAKSEVSPALGRLKVSPAVAHLISRLRTAHVAFVHAYKQYGICYKQYSAANQEVEKHRRGLSAFAVTVQVFKSHIDYSRSMTGLVPGHLAANHKTNVAYMTRKTDDLQAERRKVHDSLERARKAVRHLETQMTSLKPRLKALLKEREQLQQKLLNSSQVTLEDINQSLDCWTSSDSGRVGTTSTDLSGSGGRPLRNSRKSSRESFTSIISSSPSHPPRLDVDLPDADVVTDLRESSMFGNRIYLPSRVSDSQIRQDASSMRSICYQSNVTDQKSSTCIPKSAPSTFGRKKATSMASVEQSNTATLADIVDSTGDNAALGMSATDLAWDEWQQSSEDLTRVAWFKPHLDRLQSETLLSCRADGTFLVRSSRTGHFALSVVSGGRTFHCQVYERDNKFGLTPDLIDFDDLDALISRFRTTSLEQYNPALQTRLLHPVD